MDPASGRGWAPLRIAAVLLAVQAAVLVAAGMYTALAPLLRPISDVGIDEGEAALALGAGALYGWLARALPVPRRWARSPVVLLQSLIGLLGVSLLQVGSDLPGAVLLAVSVAVLLLVLVPSASREPFSRRAAE